MGRGVVISLFDTTSLMLAPWAKNGYECHAFDIQNDDTVDENGIHKHKKDLFKSSVMRKLLHEFSRKRVVAVFAFPPCTQLSTAGSRWWKEKEEKNPRFQIEAANRVIDVNNWCEKLLQGKPNAIFMIENPRSSKLNSLWRRFDHTFSPYQYGGYLKTTEKTHPLYPGKIPDGDRYSKHTGLWTNANFKMPPKRSVENIRIKVGDKYHSPIMVQKSANIRSATPRGFAKAVFKTHSR